MYLRIWPVITRNTRLTKLTRTTTKFNVPRFIISTKADPQNPAELQR
ncbi:MAG: hypothetical protein ACYTDW_04985 [Planctomycetota bacterium]